MFPVADLAAYLVGAWRLERSLRDEATGQSGMFRGSVSYRPDSDGGLVQYESGELVWGDHRGRAYRCLLLRSTGDRGALEVQFEDGRHFHLLDLRSGSTTAEHPCGPDLYTGEFHVVSEHEWRYRWWITGPHKMLRLDSGLDRDRV